MREILRGGAQNSTRGRVRSPLLLNAYGLGRAVHCEPTRFNLSGQVRHRNGAQRTGRSTGLSASGAAFTLVELLVVVLVLAFLLPLLALGLTRTDPASKSLQCLYNTRQLEVAWQMYAHDCHDKIIPVLQGAEAQGGTGDPTLGSGWVAGWLDWSLSSDNTNTAFLTNPKYARIAAYLLGTTNLFKCPADKYLSPMQQTVRWGQRARSYAANLTIGPGNAKYGPWDTFYPQITKTSDFVFPSPAETFVYLDEHPDSINDPGFYPPRQTALVDFPATFHNDGASFSFADGHAELHKWTGCMTRPTARQILGSNGIILGITTAGDPDIHWLSYHSQRPLSTSY